MTTHLARVMPNSPRTRTLSVPGLTAIHASCFIAIKAGLPLAPPLRFAGLRALIARTALLVLVIIMRRPVFPLRQYWVRIAILAVAATSAASGAMFLAPGRTGVGIASVLGNTQPLITVALAAMVLRSR